MRSGASRYDLATRQVGLPFRGRDVAYILSASYEGAFTAGGVGLVEG